MKTSQQMMTLGASIAAVVMTVACGADSDDPAASDESTTTTTSSDSTGVGGALGGGGSTSTSSGGGGEAPPLGGGGGGVGGTACEGFFDPLDGQTSAIQTGGELSADGWTVTANGNRLDWPHQRIGTEGVLEFDVTGLGGDQECGGQAAGSRGKCRLWLFGADDQGGLNQSKWAATGRTIAENFLCDPPDGCDPNDYIDKVRLGVIWHNPSPAWSQTAFDWDPNTWYHMTVEWTCERLDWYRDSGNGEQLLVWRTPVGGTKCYAPEDDPDAIQPATQMTFMIGGGIFGAVGATFKNVSYTPSVCSDVLPAGS